MILGAVQLSIVSSCHLSTSPTPTQTSDLVIKQSLPLSAVWVAVLWGTQMTA